MMQFAAPTVNVVLKNVMMFAAPGQHNVFYRPLVTQFNAQLGNRLAEVTNDGLNIDHSAIREIAREILAPSAQAMGRVSIRNGWDAPRFSVFMEFEVTTPSHTYIIVVTGFTDYLGVSPATGFIDYGMAITITGIIRISARVNAYAPGSYSQLAVVDNLQVLRPIEVDAFGAGTFVADQALRPTDALIGIQRTMRDMSGTVDNRTDLQGSRVRVGVANDRFNNLSSHYLSRMLKGYSLAHADSMGGIGGEEWMLGAAANYAKRDDGDLSGNAVLNMLCEGTTLALTGMVTIGELMAKFPYQNPQNWTIQMTRNAETASLVNDFQHWGASTQNTVVAHALSHAIPAAMSKLAIAEVSFNVSNMNLMHQNMAALTGCKPLFQSDNDVRFAAGFQEMLEQALIPEIVGAGIGDYDINVSCSLMGMCYCNVSLNGQPVEPFAMPLYADSMATSNLANQELAQQHTTNLQGVLNATFGRAADPGYATTSLQPSYY